MAMNTYPMIIEDGHMYAKVTLRDVVEKCDVSDLPILSEVKRLYDENVKLRELVAELWALADGYTPDDSELDTARDLMRELLIEATA